MTKAKANSSDWIALIAQMMPYLIQLIIELIKNQQGTKADQRKLKAAVKKLQKLV